MINRKKRPAYIQKMYIGRLLWCKSKFLSLSSKFVEKSVVYFILYVIIGEKKHWKNKGTGVIKWVS
ncbi:hypothetical protein CD32_06950 [Lysinibacillus odysseyi 34hs-1 = NBRC 100172]|uniref:Uncharacterized protein n=1 Tax=Lysinibacillus odysseyi 34hs-1 = NBRC 100172 TaxID=1220589 RepID=A0A0A3IRP2_9BACI|nr:hypothetical protein CD32_06950 [Lysinibacillus odysseyi 34hs-1 = NBRC 100172]